MSYYGVLLFLHIAAAAVWIGGGVLLLVLGGRLTRVRDRVTLRGLFDQSAWLSNRVFIPASLAVLVLGILLVIEGPWSFGELWILLGLAGFAATFATGMLVLKPEGDRIAALLQRDGMTDEAAAGIRRMFTLMRIDYAVLLMVVADMALKPTVKDVAVLVAMAAVILGVTAFVLRRLRVTPATAGAGQSA